MSENEEDFAALFAASEQTRAIRNGQAIEGTIVKIGREVAFVNIGAKGEATIELTELANEDGVVEAKVGDRIHATVLSTRGGIALSRKLQRGAATARQLEDAYRAGLPVEGKVEAEVKGGFTVTIAKQRAFCPMSQIDIIRDTVPASHIGRVYTFKIIEYQDNGRKFVVSRRSVQQEEQKARAAEVRQSIVVGAQIAGRVVSVRDFGAFIDLGGGVQGLLHVSEMGWSRVTDPGTVAKPGQELTVRVLRVDEANGQIALGLKQLLDDPWSTLPESCKVGQVTKGKVERHADFGVFVSLAPGITGLVPASETGIARDASLAKAFPAGSDITVTVLEIDAASRRIRLSCKAVAEAAEAAEVKEYTEREAAQPAPAFGSLAEKISSALKNR